jgi:two-component system, OmpR family, response regulator
MRILLIEDDSVLRDVVQASLTASGHRVDAAATARDAAQLWLVQAYDAVLLDLNLPDGSGLDVLREARARGDATPVLVLTARNRTEERIAGLDAGADDYLGKPFELLEIEARLRALARRAGSGGERPQVGRLVLDRRSRRFSLQPAADSHDTTLTPEFIDLPAREYEVLEELISPPGRVVNKRQMAQKLSSFEDLLADNSLEAFISRLRRRLLGSGATIRTLRGLGYVLEAEAA